ncbi:LAFA_0G08174g1_1 [Lachancea sp. 'fantastica']|nr:LAFA_0G08174g1_1 [Lachancea sp. 'fantastica']
MKDHEYQQAHRQYNNPSNKSRQNSEIEKNDRISFKYFLEWLVTLDTATPGSKNYRALPKVTNYVFFFGGRLRTVSDLSARFIVALVVQIVPVVLFSVFEAAPVWRFGKGHGTLVVLFYYSWALCMASFIKSATGDPGVLPRNLHVPTLSNDFELPQEYYNIITLPSAHPEGRTLDVKYCTTCRIWRPPRASHCPNCDACIMTHDHHCIWTNNCIGQRNYRFFLTFLAASVVCAILCIIVCAIHVSRVQHISSAAAATFLIVYSTLALSYPLLLLLFHVIATTSQQTTREYLKNLPSKKAIFHTLTSPDTNPFDHASPIKNMISLACQPRGLSVMSVREKHQTGDWRFLSLPEPHNFEKNLP